MPTFLQNNQSITIDTELRTTTCWCGIHFAIPKNLLHWARVAHWFDDRRWHTVADLVWRLGRQAGGN